MTELVLIAAVAGNKVIGKDGKIPWDIPADRQRFRRLTMGHPVIIGRKTYESVGMLEGRTNIVVSRTMPQADCPEGVLVSTSIFNAINEASRFGDTIYCAGGEQLYSQTIGLASRLEITRVHQGIVDSHAHLSRFPHISRKLWREAARENHEGYSFITYRRFA